MIYVLPGMGADSGMYPAIWRTLPASVFVDWPAYRGEKTIAEVAHRVVKQYAISPGAILIGSSLGGMVAGEIARLRRIDHLILVGSARNKEEVGGLLKLLGPLADLAPLAAIQQALGKLPSELLQMFSRAEPPFVRAMCRAIFDWPGMDEPSARVLRIHGKHDRVIPLPADADLVLDGGHLIAMTHAEECVAFIKAELFPDPVQPELDGSSR
jgi:pimeloyl-ACP methyl ester carboxylesterase